MRKERKTKKKRIGLWVVLSILVIIAIYFFSVWSSLVSLENDVERLYKEDQSIYSNTQVQIMSAAKIADEYSDQVTELVAEGMKGRFGADGSDAAFQWFSENNITISPELYTKIQQIMEAGYNKHQKCESERLQVIKILKDKCEKPLYVPVANLLGFPRIDVEAYEKVIMTDQAIEDFEDKTMEPVKMFD